MTVKEKNTGKRITMKRVGLETSRVCAEELHYVHKSREDEIIAFGAYVEDYDFPFAWVSYSPIGTEAEQTIATHTGREPNRTLEMTRAWNATWSPKNTMSVLFSYAHSQLQNMSKQEMLPDVTQGLGGVITAINPNLGFSGMAFSGVDFGVVGLKPTNHKFLLENGVPIYMLRRDIAKHLGVAITALVQHPRYGESSMPLLHTNVMMVLFDKSPMSNEQTPEQQDKARIAQLNDEFRRSGPTPDWIATAGAIALSNFPGLVQAVRDYDDFTPGNDPYGEHDFGNLTWDNEKTYWKIDYYDQALQYGEDALSPLCRRIMTILLASEY